MEHKVKARPVARAVLVEAYHAFGRPVLLRAVVLDHPSRLQNKKKEKKRKEEKRMNKSHTVLKKLQRFNDG